MVSTGGGGKAKLTVAVEYEAKGIRVCQSTFFVRVEIIMSPFTVISCVSSQIKGRSFIEGGAF